MKNTNYFDFGYVRAIAVSPQLLLGKPVNNAKYLMELASSLNEKESLIILFPELSLTGSTCGDLFFSQNIVNETKKAIDFIVFESLRVNSIIVIGHPYQCHDGRMFNCSSVIYKGKILAMIPKIYGSTNSVDRRWFSNGMGVDLNIKDFNQSFRLCSNQVINFKNKVIIGVDLCDDESSNSVNASLSSCNIILKPRASIEAVGASKIRTETNIMQSGKMNVGILYSSAGAWESSTDSVFSGATMACEGGVLLCEGERLSFKDVELIADFDVNKIASDRRKKSRDICGDTNYSIFIEQQYTLSELSRKYLRRPFVDEENKDYFNEVINIQATGLARRMLSIGKPKLILGLSGGLDSTLALIVCLEAIKKVEQEVRDIVCISMPSFGTSDRTKNQARQLAEQTGVTFKEIDITSTVKSHFKDIGHDETNYNIVFENAQARERTKVLFDVANQEEFSGLVVNTSDLSECMVGFSTFNADQTGHYGVNSSVPKTLAQALVGYYKGEVENKELEKTLQAVIDSKISPELMPTENGEDSRQQSEESVGPYILVDFFAYHVLENGFGIEKITEIATLTFKEYSPETISKWVLLFFKRFKKSQFKRTNMPAGVNVFISISPRGHLILPDEMD